MSGLHVGCGLVWVLEVVLRTVQHTIMNPGKLLHYTEGKSFTSYAWRKVREDGDGLTIILKATKLPGLSQYLNTLLVVGGMVSLCPGPAPLSKVY